MVYEALAILTFLMWALVTLPVRIVADALKLAKAARAMGHALATAENPYLACQTNGELDEWLD